MVQEGRAAHASYLGRCHGPVFSAKVCTQEFREEMGGCTGLTAVEAVVRELQRAALSIMHWTAKVVWGNFSGSENLPVNLDASARKCLVEPTARTVRNFTGAS